MVLAKTWLLLFLGSKSVQLFVTTGGYADRHKVKPWGEEGKSQSCSSTREGTEEGFFFLIDQNQKTFFDPGGNCKCYGNTFTKRRKDKKINMK